MYIHSMFINKAHSTLTQIGHDLKFKGRNRFLVLGEDHNYGVKVRRKKWNSSGTRKDLLDCEFVFFHNPPQ